MWDLANSFFLYPFQPSLTNSPKAGPEILSIRSKTCRYAPAEDKKYRTSFSLPILLLSRPKWRLNGDQIQEEEPAQAAGHRTQQAVA